MYYYLKYYFIAFILTISFTGCITPKHNDVKIDSKGLSLKEFTQIIATNLDKKIIFEKEVEEELNFNFPQEGIQKDELIALLNSILTTKGMTLINMGSHYLVLGGCANEEADILKLNDIKEAMYRHLLQNKKTNLKYYFLAFKNGDESTNILERLKDIQPQVLPKSMSKRYNKEEMKEITKEVNEFDLMTTGTLVHHKENGGKGILYFISCVNKISDSKVIVTWGNYVNMLNASESNSTLERIEGKWIVTNTKLKWVS